MGGFRGTPARSGVRTLALALASVGLVAGLQAAQAATIGHARLVSGPGEPLRIVVPVHEVPASEAETLRVSIPQASDWAAAGLSPPVALDTLGFDISPGFAPNTRVITLRSGQPFNASVVDLLIDVSSASGRQRHQVSLLAPAGAVVSAPVTAPAGAGGDAQGRQVRVRQGDNLFGIARRNAVPGVTVYQMMVGLYQQNPSAFIQKNLNLVRAGATLRVPDRATLTAISDREARRIFDQHARAFALYRNRLAVTPDVVAAPSVEQAAGGQVQSEPSVAPPPVTEQPPSDRLRLSGAVAGNGQVGASSTQGAQGAGSGAVNGGNGAGNGAVSGAGAGINNGGNSVGGNGGGNGSPAGSVLGGAQAAAPAYAGAADDDRVAQERALGDARSRVTELEDTVRELRDALADITGAGTAASAAGGSSAPLPAASGAAQSVPPAGAGSQASANGVSASSPGAVASAPQGPGAGNAGQSGVVDPAAQNSGASPSVSSAAAQAGSAPDASGAATGESSGQSGQARADVGGDAPEADITGNAGATDAPSTSSPAMAATGNNGGADSSASGSVPGVPPSDQPSAASSSSPASPSLPGATAGDASGRGSGASATGGAETAPGAKEAADAATGVAAGVSNSASGSNGSASLATTGQQGTETDNRARQVAEPITEKAEKTVSWLQENLIAIGGGILALIVLFVLWLLRRSGRPADDGENAITEAMIREKLEKIDLDLSSSSDAGNSRER